MSLVSGPVLQKIKEKIAATNPDPSTRKVFFVYVFHVTQNGNIVQSCTLDLKNLKSDDGVAENPDAVITIDDETLVKIGTGQISKDDAISQGKLKLEGNPEALEKFEFLQQKYRE